MSDQNSQIRETRVNCLSNHGIEICGQLLSLSRHKTVFEICIPNLVLQASEVLSEFRIMAGETAIYSGRGVVRSVINTGVVTVCEAALEESGWRDIQFTGEMLRDGALARQFRVFMDDWQKSYRIVPEYKVVIADMQSYFAEMRIWLEQVEVTIRASPSEDRLKLEDEAAEELARPIIPCVNALFERFEDVADRLDEEQIPAHRGYMRRQLHPLLLCSPFAYRTYQKPLGYAGDYETVDMMLRTGQEGGSLFAKVINNWFLHQAPAEAHRNRIDYLIRTIEDESLRTLRAGRPARILSIGCGPAREVQGFLNESAARRNAEFDLVDFNEETLRHARTAIDAVANRRALKTPVKYIRKSVQQILKESGRIVQQPATQYDLIYCAGLFDYLSDQICQRLLITMFERLAPGGLLIGTNVDPSNPLRHGMEHLLDWHLIHRTAPEMSALAPSHLETHAARVTSENTGVNLFLEVRRLSGNG